MDSFGDPAAGDRRGDNLRIFPVVTQRTDCGLTQLGAITCGQAIGRITLLGGFAVDVNSKIKGDHERRNHGQLYSPHQLDGGGHQFPGP